MATTMKKETMDKQYAQYQQAYLKNQERGNIRSIEGLNGLDIQAPMISRKTFEAVANDYLSEMSSKDSYRKSILGKTIFNDLSAKYTKEQEAHFRRDIGAQLDFLRVQDKKAYNELFDLIKGHTYKSGGRTYIRTEFFGEYMIDILDLFFAAGGKIGDS